MPALRSTGATMAAAERITVLGAGGFIGSHLVRHLQQAGCEPFAPGRGDARVFTEDLGHVVYAIGLTADFRTRPLDTVEAHVCLLRRLLAEGRFASLTYLSSTRVYAGAASTSESVRLSVNPCDAGDLYNLSKLTGEALCLHGGRPGLKVARLSNIVGLRPDPDIFIDQLLEEGRRLGHIELRTALRSRKDYLHVDDAVSLLGKLAVSPAAGIFNVASGEGVENGEIAEMLRTHMGYGVSVQAGAPVWDFQPVEIARIRDVFGFAPRPFAEYFPQFLNLYRQRKGI